MSTLTKILIVLMTIASIFLCGIVVTYVATADNYKQKYDALYVKYQSVEQKRANAETQLEEAIKQSDQQQKELNNKIALLNKDKERLIADVNAAKTERDMYLYRVDRFEALVKGLTGTNDQQGVLLKNTISRLESAEANLITEQNQHKETARLLLEKMAIITSLDEKNKRMQEESIELQTRLDQYLRQYGKGVAQPTPVTPIREIARPATPPAKEIGLEGKIVDVDLNNKMAEISIGKAHGVEKDMRFHVTRGERFICDIVISDVEPEKAVGRLEIIQAEPKAGDNVSTNL